MGAVYDAYGEAGIGIASVVSNRRFPGQYYDAESGLHYNYWRYYDSGTGGYVRSDPIGLDGGVKTYAYANGNPVTYLDPLGLANFHFHGNWGGPGTVNGQQYRPGGYTGRFRKPRPESGWTEGDKFPRKGDYGWVEPEDPEDWAYYHHDTCLNDCENLGCGTDAYSACQAQCDDDLANNKNVPWWVRTFFRGHGRSR